MTIWHAAIIGCNYLVGFILASVFVRVTDVPFSDVLPLLIGLLFVLLFTGSLNRMFGLLPPPPMCPKDRCGSRDYELITGDKNISKWRCKACGQLLILKDDSADILDQDGNAIVARIKLMRPHFIGWWRKQLPVESDS